MVRAVPNRAAHLLTANFKKNGRVVTEDPLAHLRLNPVRGERQPSLELGQRWVHATRPLLHKFCLGLEVITT